MSCNPGKPTQEKNADGIMVPNGKNDQQHQQDRQQMDVQPGVFGDLDIGEKDRYQLRKGDTLQVVDPM